MYIPSCGWRVYRTEIWECEKILVRRGHTSILSQERTHLDPVSGQDTPWSRPGEDTPRSQPGEDRPRSRPGEDIPQSRPGEDRPRSWPGEDTPRSWPGEDTPRSWPGEGHISILARRGHISIWERISQWLTVYCSGTLKPGPWTVRKMKKINGIRAESLH